MNAKMLVMVSAGAEAITGISLVAVPQFLAKVLLGADLADSGIAIARLTGVALLSLGLACWPSSEGAGTNGLRALSAYNLLTAFYLVYLRLGGGFDGLLLWPTCALHALLAALLTHSLFFDRSRAE